MKLNLAIVITAHNRAYDINSYRTIVIKKRFVNFSFDVIESCINAQRSSLKTSHIVFYCPNLLD